MTLLEATFAKLKELPEEKIQAVSVYIDSLDRAHVRGRFDDLTGCLSAEEADLLDSAIKESCEHVEPGNRGW